MRRGLVTAGVLLAALAGIALGAFRRESLLYSRFDVEPGEWRYFEFPVREEARLDARFDVLSPREAGSVRLLVLTSEEFERYRESREAEMLDSTRYRRRGRLETRLAPGSHVVVVEGRKENDRRARVDLEMTLLTGPDPETLPVSYASPEKRLTVVAVSLTGFLLILGWAGRALWRAAKANPKFLLA